MDCLTLRIDTGLHIVPLKIMDSQIVSGGHYGRIHTSAFLTTIPSIFHHAVDESDDLFTWTKGNTERKSTPNTTAINK